MPLKVFPMLLLCVHMLLSIGHQKIKVQAIHFYHHFYGGNYKSMLISPFAPCFEDDLPNSSCYDLDNFRELSVVCLLELSFRARYYFCVT